MAKEIKVSLCYNRGTITFTKGMSVAELYRALKQLEHQEVAAVSKPQKSVDQADGW